MKARLLCGLLAVIIAYLAGVWNGLTESWWVVLAASLLMVVATALAITSAASPRKEHE